MERVAGAHAAGAPSEVARVSRPRMGDAAAHTARRDGGSDEEAALVGDDGGAGVGEAREARGRRGVRVGCTGTDEVGGVRRGRLEQRRAPGRRGGRGGEVEREGERVRDGAERACDATTAGLVLGGVQGLGGTLEAPAVVGEEGRVGGEDGERARADLLPLSCQGGTALEHARAQANAERVREGEWRVAEGVAERDTKLLKAFALERLRRVHAAGLAARRLSEAADFSEAVADVRVRLCPRAEGERGGDALGGDEAATSPAHRGVHDRRGVELRGRQPPDGGLVSGALQLVEAPRGGEQLVGEDRGAVVCEAPRQRDSHELHVLVSVVVVAGEEDRLGARDVCLGVGDGLVELGRHELGRANHRRAEEADALRQVRVLAPRLQLVGPLRSKAVAGGLAQAAHAVHAGGEDGAEAVPLTSCKYALLFGDGERQVAAE